MHQIPQNFESLYNKLHILTRSDQIAQIKTYFCAQAIFIVPSSNTFPTLEKTHFKINLVLDVPEGAKLPRLTESFRKFCALFSLGNIFQL